MFGSEYEYFKNRSNYGSNEAGDVSELDNQMRLKDRVIGDYQLTELLDLAKIAWDSNGGWISVDERCFELYRLATTEYRGKEVIKKSRITVQFKKGYNSPVEQVPLTFLAYLFEIADIPFVVRGKYIFISK